ncbi:type IV pilus assembly protein PilM [Alkaliphilus transvaalensis]|uniref:type IV pilus assembly protein PilM n=1 Tax=Alkaliphilus transvaalensis TaxID=114628 RepID=UPI000479BDAD|nr:type IV pilus assembly protein PilM [Alkaliphilus transvaalensis]
MILNKDVLSLDIGSYQTKAVVGKFQNGEILLSQAFMIPTPQNVFQDGEIIDIQTLKKAISHELNRRNIKTNKVIYSLQSTTVITREVDLPSVREEELENMLQFEVQQFFPTALDEYVIQYKVLKNIEEDEKKTRLLVAALPKLIVENYMELSKSLNLRPIALDIHSNSISKLFMKGLKIDQQDYKDCTLAVVDLGYQGININIIKDGILEFSRLLPFGGKDIDMTLINTLNLNPEEADERKKSIRTNPIENETLEALILSCIEGWAEEIQRIFKYHTSRSLGNKIDQISLMGGHSNLKDIARVIEDYFNISTSVITNLSNVKFNLPTNQRDDLDIKCYLNAMGAIIRK